MYVALKGFGSDTVRCELLTVNSIMRIITWQMTLTQLPSGLAVSLMRESPSPLSHDLNQHFLSYVTGSSRDCRYTETLDMVLRGAALLLSTCNLFIAFVKY